MWPEDFTKLYFHARGSNISVVTRKTFSPGQAKVYWEHMITFYEIIIPVTIVIFPPSFHFLSYSWIDIAISNYLNYNMEIVLKHADKLCRWWSSITDESLQHPGWTKLVYWLNPKISSYFYLVIYSQCQY